MIREKRKKQTERRERWREEGRRGEEGREERGGWKGGCSGEEREAG